MRPLILLSLAAAACGPRPLDLQLQGLGEWDAGWQVRITRETPRLAFEPDSGCLRPTAELLPEGTYFAARAMNADWVVIDADLSSVARADVEETRHSQDPALGATAVLDTTRTTFGADGCQGATAMLMANTPVEARAWAHDAQYRGVVVVDAQLQVAPLRHVDVDGVPWPWHSGVQLIKPLAAGGFVVGAGVVIGPKAILTADHLGVDGTTCFSREARTSQAWDAKKFDCDAVEGVFHVPGLTDAVVVTLKRETPPPYAKLRQTKLEPGVPFYSSRWHTLLRAELSDTTVESIGNENAACRPWPPESTFLGVEQFLQGGDSGGPAYSGDELIGITHGLRCRYAMTDPMKDAYVHVPMLLDFLAPYL